MSLSRKKKKKRFGAVGQLALERHQDTMAITAAATSAGETATAAAANKLNKYCCCAEKQQQHQQIKGRQKARDVRDDV
ncbi:uncharacterized protein LOC108112390 [Drosophila eugracilis]|uniref:uncharacterized protein LOC108112390 n=1 Tax=Drosophila eugracilis TaxID=29029 RepID=UPI001BDB571D|nr:uncharacterized protein LOC108112390 [Drosophila eugracilis]